MNKQETIASFIYTIGNSSHIKMKQTESEINLRIGRRQFGRYKHNSVDAPLKRIYNKK